MENWLSDKVKYARIVSWKVVERPNAFGKRLRMMATLPDGSERLLQGGFDTREQLDRYVDRFLPHLKDREDRGALDPRPVVDLTEDQQAFVAFIADLDDAQIRSTCQSYTFLADFGRADDIFRRDACRSEMERRGLPLPEPSSCTDKGSDLAPDCA